MGDVDDGERRRKEEENRRREEREREWREARRRKMEDAERLRKEEWEQAVKRERMRRMEVKRQEEERERREMREREEREASRRRREEEERLRWEMEQAENESIQRLKWEEEALAAQEMDDERRRFEARETRKREEVELRYEERHREIQNEMWREEEERASRQRAELAAQRVRDEMRERMQEKLDTHRREWEEAERRRQESIDRDWNERLNRTEMMMMTPPKDGPDDREPRKTKSESHVARVSTVYPESTPYARGTHVEVCYSGGQDWYVATIEGHYTTSDRESQSLSHFYTVLYENNEKETDVPHHFIRHIKSPQHRRIGRMVTPSSRLERFREFDTPDDNGNAADRGRPARESEANENRTENMSSSNSPTASRRRHDGSVRPTKDVWVGGYLVKIPRRARSVPKMRWFRVENIDGECVLAWYEKEPDRDDGLKKKSGKRRRVTLSNVYEMRRGHSTDAFTSHIEFRGASQLPPPRLCFSLVANTRSVDLAASDDESLNVWIKTLSDLMRSARGGRDGVLATRIAATNSKGYSSKPDDVAATRLVSDKTRQRWRRKMGKYVRQNHIAGVAALIKEGCPPDIALETAQTADASVDTALLLACQAGHAAMVRTLLEHGASIDPHPDVGGTALHCAVSGEHLYCVEVLLESQDCNLDDPIQPSGDTPLHTASRGAHSGIVSLLLKHGAEVTQRNANGRTSLHCACRWDRLQNVETILRHCSESSTLSRLLSIGDADGNTPLHTAAIQGHIEITRRLLDSGASALSLNKAAQTPAQAAKRANAIGCAQVLGPKQREEEARTFARAAAVTESSLLSTQHRSYREGWGSTEPFSLSQTTENPRANHRDTSTLFDGLTVSRTPRRTISTPAYSSSDVTSNRHTTRVNDVQDANYDNTGGQLGGGRFEEHEGDGMELWEVAYTDEGHRYFYNRTTNCSQWEDPREMAWTEDMDNGREGEQLHRHHPLVPRLNLEEVRNSMATRRRR